MKDSTCAATRASSCPGGCSSIRASRSSSHSAATRAGTGTPAATDTTSRAVPVSASWYSNVADSGSSRCASSTTSSRSRSASRAARRTAAVLPVSGTSTRCPKAPSGRTAFDAVPVTDAAGPSRSAAARSSAVLPTPAGPITAAPERLRTPASIDSSAGPCGATTQSTDTAGF